MATAQHQRQVGTLRDEFAQRIAALQRLSCPPGLQHRMRMHQQAVPAGRHRNRHQAISRTQRHAPQQQRADVVTMAATAGHRFAIQCKRIQRFARQWHVQQRIGRHQRGHAGGSRSAHAGAEGNALVDLDGKTEAQSQPLTQRYQRRASGVAGGFQRQLHRTAADRIDAHPWLVDAAHAHRIADTGDGVTQDVETHGHVGHRCGREGACDHSRAPSPAATRSRSANTPAAVTSGPAPGPCTTSGLSQ
ncbi:hypothetical protein D3C73_898900 [compost metagenome]